MKKIIFKIITPDKAVFEDEVYQITLPVLDGDVTILPDHIPYIASIKAGEIIVRKESPQDKGISLSVSGGFLEFHGNVLTLLADTAEHAEEIDIERAEQGRKRAEELKEQTYADKEDYARVIAKLEKEMARIRVAKKHRTHHMQHQS